MNFPYFDATLGCWVADWKITKEGDQLTFTCAEEKSDKLPYSFRKGTHEKAFLEFAAMARKARSSAPWKADGISVREVSMIYTRTKEGAALFSQVALLDPDDKELESQILEFAEKYGPLFHSPSQKGSGSACIRESYAAWVQAVSVMRLTLECINVMKNNGVPAEKLERQILIEIFARDGSYESSYPDWLARLSICLPTKLAGEYAKMLSIDDAEHDRLFPTLKTEGNWRETTWSVGTEFRMSWEEETRLPTLAICLSNVEPGKWKTLRSGDCLQPLLDASLYFDDSEGRENRRTLLLPFVEAITTLHTRRVSVGWYEEQFTLVFPCFIERIWYDLAASIANRKIGICPRCGEVFQGRPNQIYCTTGSEGCQGKAKSQRQYAKRKTYLGKK